jgi:uncharacterized protein YdhG (YjbR/CyaY superfamily)
VRSGREGCLDGSRHTTQQDFRGCLPVGGNLKKQIVQAGSSMKKASPAPADIDAYIAGFPTNIQRVLQQIRATIRKAAPGAEEKISYQMPAFAENGVLTWFAAWKEHIGFYPTPSAIRAFADELSGYQQSRGAIQFPLDQPMPLGLIRRIVQFRVRETREKAARNKANRR